MDRKLHALVKLDVTADMVRIDVRGSLNQDSRPALVHVIRRIRRMGITGHIRVDLSQAAFVESPALVGLRNDLNAIEGGASDGGQLAALVQGAPQGAKNPQRFLPAGLVTGKQYPTGVRVVALREVIAHGKDLVGAALGLDVPGEEHVGGQQGGRTGSDQEISPGKCLELGGMPEDAASG
jgi:hypothetical protein